VWKEENERWIHLILWAFIKDITIDRAGGMAQVVGIMRPCFPTPVLPKEEKM
jgi:hypothetical protein